MKNRLLIYLILSTVYLNGCQENRPSDPVCRANPKTLDTRVANAACIIRLNEKMLTVTHRLSGKFDLPGGTSNGVETAQCTAHRETWEETGFNVEVGQFLGQSDQGMHFYACQLAGNFTGELQQFPVPEWSSLEVTAIELHDPFVLTGKQWRFEDQLVQIRNMFNQVPESAATQ